MNPTIREAIIASAGESRDAIIIGLVSDHDMTLNAATKAYAEVAREQGWQSGRVSHKDAAIALLGERFPTSDGWDADAVKAVVIDLQDEYGIAESTARDYCREYSDMLGVPYPVVNPREAMFNWLIEHDGMDVDEMKAAFKAYAGDELGRSASNVNEYWKGYELHLAITAAKA